ncbi:MAG: flavodoxin domain-containing protein [bacterium]
MKILVVYYSRTGHNRQLAKELAAEVAADIEEIIESKPKGFIMSGWQSMTKAKGEIGKVAMNPGDYDRVILVAPIWFGGISPALRTYIEEYLTKIKTFACLSVSGNGNKNESYIDQLEKEYSLNIRPRLLLSDAELAKNAYSQKLEAFARLLKSDQK